jgi:hypothetical protein
VNRFGPSKAGAEAAVLIFDYANQMITRPAIRLDKPVQFGLW